MSEPVIRVEDLGKRYRIRHEVKAPYKTLRESITTGLHRLLTGLRSRVEPVEEFWALRNVSFAVRSGEVLGVIGANGAGKSTLLKVLSRITEPTEGSVTLQGRVASLLEVGTGFHGELTGRENIYLNGAILGMKRREVKRRFDAIVAFAEVERFLDTPVKRYSSGMYVRLAFAVAAHLEPDILIVDEVLAVGDAWFQKKCLDKMQSVAAGEGRTVLLVSHNMQTIRHLCDRAILFSAGRKVLEGSCGEVVERYLLEGAGDATTGERLGVVIAELPEDPAFRLRRVDVIQEGRSTTALLSGKPAWLEVDYDVLQPTPGLMVCLELRDIDGTLIFESFHNGDAPPIPVVQPGRYRSRATIPADFLAGRAYLLGVTAAIHGIRDCVPTPTPIQFRLEVSSVGSVNRAYPGYETPGRLSPLIPWRTEVVTGTPEPR
jgi:lipopolysaccharide transport system ATP-binding protein